MKWSGGPQTRKVSHLVFWTTSWQISRGLIPQPILFHGLEHSFLRLRCESLRTPTSPPTCCRRRSTIRKRARWTGNRHPPISCHIYRISRQITSTEFASSRLRFSLQILYPCSPAYLLPTSGEKLGSGSGRFRPSYRRPLSPSIMYQTLQSGWALFSMFQAGGHLYESLVRYPQ